MQDRTGPVAAGWTVAAFAWGLAEATVFFVVPDVLLTVLAQRFGLAAAVRPGIAAVAGACLGGWLMYRFGAADPAGARTLLEAVPAVSPPMIAEARAALAAGPFTAMLAGAFSGVPYKVFAALAPESGISPVALVLLTIPARGARFLTVTLAVAGLDRLAAARIGAEKRRGLLIAGWMLFYAAFWAWM